MQSQRPVIPVVERKGLTYLIIDGDQFTHNLPRSTDEPGEYKADEVIAELLKIAGFNFDMLNRRSYYEGQAKQRGSASSKGREIGLETVASLYVGDRALSEGDHMVDRMISTEKLAAVGKSLTVDCLSSIRRSVCTIEDITGLGFQTVLSASQAYEGEYEEGFFPLPVFTSIGTDVDYHVNTDELRHSVDVVLTAMLTGKSLEDVNPKERSLIYWDRGINHHDGKEMGIWFYMYNPTPSRLKEAVNAFARFFDFVVANRKQVSEAIRLYQAACTIWAVDDKLGLDKLMVDPDDSLGHYTDHMEHAYTDVIRKADTLLTTLRRQYFSSLAAYAVHTNPAVNFNF